MPKSVGGYEESKVSSGSSDKDPLSCKSLNLLTQIRMGELSKFMSHLFFQTRGFELLKMSNSWERGPMDCGNVGGVSKSSCLMFPSRPLGFELLKICMSQDQCWICHGLLGNCISGDMVFETLLRTAISRFCNFYCGTICHGPQYILHGT